MRSELCAQIVSVNTHDVSNVPHEQTIKHLQANPKTVDIVVSREVSTPHAPEEVAVEIAFKKGANGSLGFSIAGGTDDAIEVPRARALLVRC